MYNINYVSLISLACFVYAQHNPNFKYPRRAIVQLFEWKFVDITRECETFLGPNNFGGVQVKLTFYLSKILSTIIVNTSGVTCE